MIDKENIVKQAQEIHGDKYDYQYVTDINNTLEKLHIICTIHGDFYQTYWNHVHLKRGCKQCGHVRTTHSNLMTKAEFIKKATLTHTDIDNYDFTNLELHSKDDKNRITLNCKIHGNFKMRPSHFMDGNMCPYCTVRTKKR